MMMMKQGLLQWSPCRLHNHHHSPLLSLPISFPIPASKQTSSSKVLATLDSATTTTSTQRELSARERRQLRNQKREEKSGYSWREEVEERLIKKPKKQYTSWTEELNLDNLARMGHQWWVVRVARVRYEETAQRVAKSLVKNFPEMEFKVYAPSVQVKRILKNGSLSVKPRAIFPGCVFLWCVMNKQVHDTIRECEGVGGFVGSKVGNTKKQINKPRPVAIEDMETMFREAKEEQEKVDQAFLEEQGSVLELENLNSETDSKPKKQPRKSASAKGNKLPSTGSTVRIISGTFAEFEGNLQKLNRKTGKATVGVTVFGKESLVELDVNEIVAETK